MDHKREKTYSIINRIGFHYFPDCLHYGEKDIELWLPRLKRVNAQWLVLNTPAKQAIPEDFIQSLALSRIKTILDFNQPLFEEPSWSDLETLLRSYGKWGVHYAILDQRPNSQAAWGADFWKQTNLVENFMRRFLRFAGMALNCGIKPVFAPLQPGGDYWDLAFLESSLKVLADSADSLLVNNTALSAFAWDFGHSLNWGAGGPSAWRAVKAYKVPETSQDQHGFRAYEWYSQISQTILGKKLPMLMLQAGLSDDPQQYIHTNLSSSLDKQLQVYRLLQEENVFDPENPAKLLNAISPEVLACNFYVISTASANASCAWFAPDGSPSPIAQAVLKSLSEALPIEQNESAGTSKNPNFKYDTYILIADSLKPRVQEILQNMHAFIARQKPLVGFSCEEAKKSASILVIANGDEPTSQEIEALGSSGSLVKVLNPDELTVEMDLIER
jgi:hypothetical protein